MLTHLSNLPTMLVPTKLHRTVSIFGTKNEKPRKKAKARKAERVNSQVQASKARLQSKATQRRVPSSRIDRAVTFGTAGVGLAANFVKNRITSKPAEDPLLRAMGLTEGDVQERGINAHLKNLTAPCA